jgi:hypothetical protein
MNINKMIYVLLLMFVESFASGVSILTSILLFYFFSLPYSRMQIRLLSTLRVLGLHKCVRWTLLPYYIRINIDPLASNTSITYVCFFLHYWYSLHLPSHQGKKSGGSFPSRSEHLCIIYIIKPYNRTKDKKRH